MKQIKFLTAVASVILIFFTGLHDLPAAAWSMPLISVVRAARGNCTMVQMAIEEVPESEQAAYVNQQDLKGDTALIEAAWRGSCAIVALLCRVPGVEVNYVDGTGCTALIKAVLSGNPEIVKILLGVSGIDVSKQTVARGKAEGMTALDIARSKTFPFSEPSEAYDEIVALLYAKTHMSPQGGSPVVSGAGANKGPCSVEMVTL